MSEIVNLDEAKTHLSQQAQVLLQALVLVASDRFIAQHAAPQFSAR